MPEIRYYTDEHVGKAVVRGLRQRGIDVLTIPETKMLGASDKDQLDFAHHQGRVFFTQDDDFLRFAAMGVVHSGIVYARMRTPIGEVVRGLTMIAHSLNAEDMICHVEYI
ncbi:MAG: DUF5615 family PIN-like protein [Myxococcota bacterium]